MLTNLITEARELCEKATEGPWMGLRAAYEDCLLIKCDKDEYLMSQHDVAFVARSRTLIPELCDALEKAEEQIERVHKALDFAETQRQRSKNYTELAILDGMEHCFEALSRCDEFWIAEDWRDSRGCNMEYGYAKAKGIPIKFIGEGD